MNHTYKDVSYCNTKVRLNKEIPNDSESFGYVQHVQFYKKFRALLRKLDCFTNIEKIAVGISGGADSTVLLHMLSLYRDNDQGPELVCVHINHHQRGDESDRDEECSREIAKVHQCEFYVSHLNEAKKGESEGELRRLRKSSLLEFAKQHDIQRIVLGHHKNDQVETFLFRMFRGADLKGLSGMKAFQPPFVRPLLEFERTEILQQAEICSLPYIDDTSNFFTGPSRNFIRKVLLPAIESKLDPQATQHMFDLVASFQEIESYFKGQMAEMIEQVTVHQNSYSVSKLRNIPSFLRKKMILQMFHYIMDTEGSLSRDQIEMIDRWIDSPQSPKYLLLPFNKKVEKKDGVLTFQSCTLNNGE